MTYSTYELSAESGKPVELYTFTQGLSVWRYTNAAGPVTFGPDTYTPRQIERTAPDETVEDNLRVRMEIVLPTDDPISQRFIGIPDADLMTVRVVRLHRDDPNGYVVWYGRVNSGLFDRNGGAVKLTSSPVEAVLGRQFPRMKYHSMCNHVLGDARCQVDLDHADNWRDCQVVTVTSRLLTVSGLDGVDVGWANGGYAIYAGERRMIVTHTTFTGAGSNRRILLSIPFNGNPFGQTIRVVVGCDHRVETCRTKFNNIPRFGGFAFVPVRNPSSSGV